MQIFNIVKLQTKIHSGQQKIRIPFHTHQESVTLRGRGFIDKTLGTVFGHLVMKQTTHSSSEWAFQMNNMAHFTDFLIKLSKHWHLLEQSEQNGSSESKLSYTIYRLSKNYNSTKLWTFWDKLKRWLEEYAFWTYWFHWSFQLFL